MCRFLTSLVTHIRDSSSHVGVGFVIYALHLNPRLLQGIFANVQNIASLRQALEQRNYPAATILVMTMFPEKFLWPDLLSFWEGKNGEVVNQCSQILAKMDILTEPGQQMAQLTDALALRSLLAKCLMEVDRIKLSLPTLIAVLEKLAPLQSDTIRVCLQADSTKWE
jgi:hypothetical protein